MRHTIKLSSVNPEEEHMEDFPFQPTDARDTDMLRGNEISVKRIAKFAIPAVGIWLCSPLLSVIDTSAVGLLSGTLQQAALNPAVAVTDYSGRCMVGYSIVSNDV